MFLSSITNNPNMSMFLIVWLFECNNAFTITWYSQYPVRFLVNSPFLNIHDVLLLPVKSMGYNNCESKIKKDSVFHTSRGKTHYYTYFNKYFFFKGIRIYLFDESFIRSNIWQWVKSYFTFLTNNSICACL